MKWRTTTEQALGDSASRLTAFGHMGKALTGDTSFDFAAWPGQGMPLAVDVEGSVERTLKLSDQS